MIRADHRTTEWGTAVDMAEKWMSRAELAGVLLEMEEVADSGME
jgi:hypothetical protein